MADLCKRLRFLGDIGAYHFQWVVGGEVPAHGDWRASRRQEPKQMAK